MTQGLNFKVEYWNWTVWTFPLFPTSGITTDFVPMKYWYFLKFVWIFDGYPIALVIAI